MIHHFKPRRASSRVQASLSNAEDSSSTQRWVHRIESAVTVKCLGGDRWGPASCRSSASPQANTRTHQTLSSASNHLGSIVRPSRCLIPPPPNVVARAVLLASKGGFKKRLTWKASWISMTEHRNQPSPEFTTSHFISSQTKNDKLELVMVGRYVSDVESFFCNKRL